ncbi:unnamed protein product [Allacma fusca]|uniref:Protein kinase domain-containing protein n=1 Tax=Allacma fusca TaxID=39272 RepID=A0A8J2LET6_9HEXA|nr:unnamed protein product [Allacma fusca]
MDLGESEFRHREKNAFTYQYAAPELIRQNYVRKFSDLWALGAALFELFCAQSLIDTGNPRADSNGDEPGFQKNFVESFVLQHQASKNMMEIVEHISPRGQEIAQYSHLDLVRELPQQQATPN